MSTLAEIQTQTRFFAKNETIDLSTDPGLSIFNEVYRFIASIRKHPEFRFKVTLSDTVSGDGDYDWELEDVIDCGSSSDTQTLFVDCGTSSDTMTIFIDCGLSGAVYTINPHSIAAIEIETSASSDLMDFVLQPHTEDVWSEMAKSSGRKPEYWVRNNTSGDVVEFRPIPDYTGGEIRVTGYEEATALSGSAQSTKFLGSGVDDAIARLVSAIYLERDGIAGSETLVKSASSILRTFGVEING